VSAFFDHVAHAALPVAIVLVSLAAAARAWLWGGFERSGLARTYLEPLARWALLGAATYALALVAAGEAAFGPLALALGLALAAWAAAFAGLAAPADAERETAPREDGVSTPAAAGRGLAGAFAASARRERAAAPGEAADRGPGGAVAAAAWAEPAAPAARAAQGGSLWADPHREDRRRPVT
jgi:hypothetical protein